jgi:type VI secretion system secreted protein Hcp
MEIEGNNQGTITSGCSREENREDTTKVFELKHGVAQPRDKHTGRSTGKRIHQPFVVLKELDACSPLLYQALCTNELMTVTFRFYRPNPDGDGKEEQFFTVVIEEANLTSYEGKLPFTLGEDTDALPPLEELVFSYRKVRITEERNGVEYEDYWDMDMS